MVTAGNGQCNVCGISTHQLCSSCKSVFYCSKDCQKKQWKEHKPVCRPFVVQEHQVYGRYLVASRDIKAGEIFLKEAPIILGPKQCSLPICLGCHQNIQRTDLLCKLCKYPICSKLCQDSKFHKSECGVLAAAKSRLRFSDLEAQHPAYECITPLRCLLLKEDEPKKWEQLINLQSHIEDLRDTEIYKINQRNIVEFIRVFLGYTRETEDCIHRICGILLTNSFELNFNKQRIRGIYATASMMAHNCVPNAKQAFDKKENIIFRATHLISKGSPICLTYSNRLWDTFSRLKGLKVTKFFLCSCELCSSPTELEANTGTLLCSKCGSHVTSTEPLKLEADWACCECGHRIPAKQIEWGHKVLIDELKRLGKCDDPSSLESFIDRYKKTLHPNHRFILEAKFALVKLYGNFPSFYYKDLSPQQINNKTSYTEQLLKICNTIDPGKSLLRGNLLFELQAALVAQAKVRFSNDEVTEQETKENVSKATTHLEEASEILRHEPELADGGLEEKLKWLSAQLDM